MTAPSVLRLRPMVPADAAAIAAWGSDPDFCRDAGWRYDLPEGELLAFWTDLIADPPRTLHRLTAVLEDELVGYVDLHGEDPEVLELGYVIGPSSRWGQGLGTAAARLGLRYAFTVLDLVGVWAEAPASNTASVRILQRLRMLDAGLGEATVFADEPTRYLRFSITRAEWQATLERAPGRESSHASGDRPGRRLRGNR